MNLPELAKQIATRAHAGQTRRDGKTPYITHPEAVADRFMADVLVAIAWLHDTLEDTSETPDSLRSQGVPEQVVSSVVAMTKTPGEEYFAYLGRVRADPLARLVKIQDMLHNLGDQPTYKQIRKYCKGLLYLTEERT